MAIITSTMQKYLRAKRHIFFSFFHTSLKRTQAAADKPSMSQNDRWWKKIWKLDIPPKVRVFWWRVLFLISFHTIKKRHVLLEDHRGARGAYRSYFITMW